MDHLHDGHMDDPADVNIIQRSMGCLTRSDPATLIDAGNDEVVFTAKGSDRQQRRGAQHREGGQNRRFAPRGGRGEGRPTAKGFKNRRFGHRPPAPTTLHLVRSFTLQRARAESYIRQAAEQTIMLKASSLSMPF